MKRAFSVIFIAMFSMCWTSRAMLQESSANIVCKGRYVLCTSAPCIPDPSDPKNKSICSCVVENGKSYGNNPCATRKPSTLPGGIKLLISTYSFEQAATNHIMQCPSGKPWSNCLNRPCIVDPADPKKAICSCDIVKKGTFVTYGGNCDRSTCGKNYWSGATVDAYESTSAYLARELGLPGDPAKKCAR